MGKTRSVLKCSNMLQTGALMKRKKGGAVGTHFKNESDNDRVVVKISLACNEKIGYRTSCQLSFKHSTPELNQEEVTASAHHRPQVCAVDEHLPPHAQSIRAVGAPLLCCNPPNLCRGRQSMMMTSCRGLSQLFSRARDTAT